MKSLLRTISIIIEVIIALAIFIMIAKKTPLFDRAIPWRDNGLSSWSTIQISQTTTTTSPAVSSTTTATTNSSTTNATVTTSSSYIPEQPVSIGKSCTSPRWTVVKDTMSITTYRSATANSQNQCFSEVRTCHDGILWWSYTIKTCNYILNGRLIQADGSKKDIIAWASNSDQQLVDVSDYYKKRNSVPKHFIQPTSGHISSSFELSDIKQKMDNSKKMTNNDLTDTLDQTTRQDDHSQSTGSCISPRWTTIPHGTFIYAYNKPNDSLDSPCIAQKRACIDGKLSGSFHYESCIQQPAQPSPILISAYPSIHYGGILLPKQRYVRPLSESISDTLLLSYSSSSNSTTTSQNTIQIKNCLTPRWTTLANNERITAYRLPTETNNSLCDSETRVCRDGNLWGSYTYQSCSNVSHLMQTSDNDDHGFRRWFAGRNSRLYKNVLNIF